MNDMENKDANSAINQGYQEFTYKENYVYDKGWDKYAEDYSQLLKPGTTYYLTKEIAHQIVSEFLPGDNGISVLDLNCGTGNDFPYFLKNGWKICGCDGSDGMLNKAYEKYKAEINNGQIELFNGKLENLDEQSFGNRKFDLIYSITGGYSYIDNETFIHVNTTLSHFLKENGVMITAHLNNFCLSDTLYNLFRFRLKSIFLRLDKNLNVNIKGVKFRMYLRNVNELKKLTPPGLKMIRTLPLLVFTPPYQTGYQPTKLLYKIHRKFEMKLLKIPFFGFIADQIVTVYRKT